MGYDGGIDSLWHTQLPASSTIQEPSKSSHHIIWSLRKRSKYMVKPIAIISASPAAGRFVIDSLSIATLIHRDAHHFVLRRGAVWPMKNVLGSKCILVTYAQPKLMTQRTLKGVVLPNESSDLRPRQRSTRPSLDYLPMILTPFIKLHMAIGVC